MKKVVVVLMVFLIIFPLSAINLVIMKNNNVYTGEILSLDVNGNVMIKEQDGQTRTIRFKDINTIKQISMDSNTSVQPIIIQNTNNNSNTNITDSEIKTDALKTKVLDRIIYLPNTDPPEYIYHGITYKVSNTRQLIEFFTAIRNEKPKLSHEIDQMMQEIVAWANKDDEMHAKVKSENTKIWLSLACLLGGLLITEADVINTDSITATGIIGISISVGSALSFIGSASKSYGYFNERWQAINEYKKQLRNMAEHYNSIYGL